MFVLLIAQPLVIKPSVNHTGRLVDLSERSRSSTTAANLYLQTLHHALFKEVIKASVLKDHVHSRNKTMLLYLVNLLITAANDIHSNPGPNETVYPCGTCDLPVTWSDRGIMCDTCTHVINCISGSFCEFESRRVQYNFSQLYLHLRQWRPTWIRCFFVWQIFLVKLAKVRLYLQSRGRDSSWRGNMSQVFVRTSRLILTRLEGIPFSSIGRALVAVVAVVIFHIFRFRLCTV